MGTLRWTDCILQVLFKQDVQGIKWMGKGRCSAWAPWGHILNPKVSLQYTCFSSLNAKYYSMSITVNEYIFWLIHVSELLCILLKSKGTSPKPGVHSLTLTILVKSWWSYTHFNPDTGGKSETLERNVLKSIFCIWKFGRLVRKEQSQNLDVSSANNTNPSSNHLGALDTQVLLPNLLLGLEHILNLGWINKSRHQEDNFLTFLIMQ